MPWPVPYKLEDWGCQPVRSRCLSGLLRKQGTPHQTELSLYQLMFFAPFAWCPLMSSVGGGWWEGDLCEHAYLLRVALRYPSRSVEQCGEGVCPVWLGIPDGRPQALFFGCIEEVPPVAPSSILNRVVSVRQLLLSCMPPSFSLVLLFCQLFLTFPVSPLCSVMSSLHYFWTPH